MISLLSSLWAQRLGWALLHFLWQGTAIVLIHATIRRLLRRWLSAPGRYFLACATLAAMTLAPVVTLLVLANADTGAASPASAQAAWLTLTAPAGARLLPSVVGLWLAGVLFFSVRLFGGLRFTAHLKSTAHPAPAAWQEALDQIAAGTRRARLLVSALVDVPTVVGWLRPVILVPVEFFTGLPAGHLEALLAHEFAHIRRHDYLANVMQSIAEAVLFYHPAVWWISEQIRAERELCCDDFAVAASGDPLTYAHALADLESRRRSRFQLAPAANGGSLVDRIRRLTEPKTVRGNNLPGAGPAWAMIALWLTGAGAAAVHAAQTPAAVPAPASVVNITPIPLSPPNTRPNPFADLAGRARNTLLADPIFSAQVAAPPQNPANAAPTDDKLETPWRKWVNEDVAYIITDNERQAFRQLTTDQEREQFVQQFWLRRDPTPGTVENEYQEEHYRRIAYANEHFASRVPGWKTDRGKIYILYGPPDELDSHPSGIPPTETWRYRFIGGIGNNVAVEFVDTNMNGEYPMALDPANKGGARQANLVRAVEQLRVLALRQFEAGRKSPEPAATATSRVLPMQARVDYVPLTDTAVLTNITAQFANRDLRFQTDNNGSKATVNLTGSISTMAGQLVSGFEKALTVNVAPANFGTYAQLHSEWQQSVALTPGRYQLSLMASDTASGNSNNYQIVMEVPQPEETKLASSSLILADTIEKLPAKTIGVQTFAIGDSRVRPRPGNQFSSGESMGIYLQVYNFQPDETTGKLSGSIEYEIQKAGSDGKIMRFSEEAGNIPNASPRQVTIKKLLPLRTFVPGAYTLTVKVSDRVGNQSVEQQGNFTVDAR